MVEDVNLALFFSLERLVLSREAFFFFKSGRELSGVELVNE